MNKPNSETKPHEFNSGAEKLIQDRERLHQILVEADQTQDLPKLEDAVRQIREIVSNVQDFSGYIADIKSLIRRMRKLSSNQNNPDKESTKQSSTAGNDAPPKTEEGVNPGTEQQEQNRQEKRQGVQDVIDRFEQMRRENIGKKFPVLLGIENPKNQREVKVKYARFVSDLNTASTVLQNATERKMRGWPLDEDDKNDLIVHAELTSLYQYFKQMYEELLAGKDRTLSENISDEVKEGKKQEKKTDPNDIHIIVTLAQELTRLRTRSPAPLREALNKINFLFQQIQQTRDVPNWFRSLREKVFRIEVAIQSDPYSYGEHPENYNELASVSSELMRLFGEITYFSQEVEKKKWENYEEDFLKGNSFESLSNLSFLLTSLDDLKRGKRFPDALVDRWQKAIKTMQELLEDESILDVPLNTLSDKLQGLFVSKNTWARASDFIAREVVKKKKERVKPQLLEKLQETDSFESAIGILFSYTGFIQEAGAMKGLLSYVTEEGKKKISLEKRKPIGVMFLEKSQDFWKKIEDIELKQMLRPLFEAWAKDKQELWWVEIEQNKEALKTELQQRISQVIPLYVEGMISDNQLSGQVFTPEQTAQLQLSISQRIIEKIIQLTSQLDLGKHTGVRASIDLGFIRSDERFSSTQTEQMRRRDLLFTFQDREKVGWSEHHREPLPSEKKLSAEVWQLCDQVSRELSLERSRLVSTTTFLIEGKPHLGREIRPKANGILFKEKTFSSMNDTAKDYSDQIIPILVARLLQESSVTTELKKKKALQEQYRIRFNSYFFSKDKTDERMWQEAIPLAIEYVSTSLGIPRKEVENVSQELHLPPSQESLVRLVDTVLRNESGGVGFVDEESLTLPEDTQGKDLREITKANLKAGLSIPRGDEFRDNLLNRNVIPKKWMDADAQTRETNIREFIANGLFGYNILGYNGTLYGAKETMMTERLKKLSETTDINFSGAGMDLAVKISDYLSEQDINEIVAIARDAFDRDEAMKVIRFKLDTSSGVRTLINNINIFVDQEMQKALENPEAYLQQCGGISMQNNLRAVDWFNIFFNVVKGKFDQSVRDDHPNLVFSSDRALQTSRLLPVLRYGISLREKDSVNS